MSNIKNEIKPVILRGAKRSRRISAVNHEIPRQARNDDGFKSFGFWALTLGIVFSFILALSSPVSAQLLIEAVPEPNDPFYFANQASYFGQIKLWDAWIKTTGSVDVVIAIIDSGVDMDHPDLIGNMWFNKKEIPLNGADDDNNGYVDDLNGWDFLENTSDPHPKLHDGKSFGGLNHGTVVAGIAAAYVLENYNLEILLVEGERAAIHF